MNVLVYVSVSTCARVYLPACVCACMSACTQACVCMRTCLHVSACVSESAYACVCLCVRTCVSASLCKHVHVARMHVCLYWHVWHARTCMRVCVCECIFMPVCLLVCVIACMIAWQKRCCCFMDAIQYKDIMRNIHHYLKRWKCFVRDDIKLCMWRSGSQGNQALNKSCQLLQNY